MMRAEIRLGDCPDLEILKKSLAPETVSDISRTEVEVVIAEADGELVITIRSEDLSSLRAALNSYLRWLKLAMETNELAGQD